MIPILLYCFALNKDKTETPLQHARGLFVKSYSSKAQCYEFHSALKQIDIKNNFTLSGYKAVSEIMLCRHLLNPINKLNHFNIGREQLEESIRLAPNNIELRFLRYSVQKNAPQLLRYNSNVKEDKACIERWLQHDKQTDPELYEFIREYMQHYKTVAL